MNILALNCGSSSIKYQLFSGTNNICLAFGQVERVGSPNALLKHAVHGESAGEPIHKTFACKDHEEGVGEILEVLFSSLPKGTRIDAVGHRVVHGGHEFAKSVIITDEVIATVERLIPLAPLHNPPNLAGIRAMKNLMPETPQVAVFDTAFHQTMPPEAYTYAVPAKWKEELGVRRYGFHGTSHLYVARKISQMLGQPLHDLRIITCHIGNGASVSAVKYGQCIDTSMGLTPLEGVVMGTRSGSIDPGLIPYVATQTHSKIEDVFEALNKKSGMLGLTGFNDLRDVEMGHIKGDIRCTEALKTYAYSIKKYIGAYTAAMGGVDIVVFTAGVGENSAIIRELATDGLGYLGAFLDEEYNKTIRGGKEALISVGTSPVKIAVVHTNEELVIVEDTMALLNGRNPANKDFKYSFENEAPVWNAAGQELKAVMEHLERGHKEFQIPVAVSNRHVHISAADAKILFGENYKLNAVRPLAQPGQYATDAFVTLVGPKGYLEKVRVLGPERKSTQVEISQTDAVKLGVSIPVRDSGDLRGSGEITLRGPQGEVKLNEGLILSVRHVHMHTDDAQRFGVKDKERVVVRTIGDRPVVFGSVLVRVSDQFALEMHIDTDEANASLLHNGDSAILCV